MSGVQVYYGTLVHSLSLKELETIEQGVIVVEDGIITQVERNVKDVDTFLTTLNLTNYKLHRLEPKQFLLPGLVDTHAHAPQYVFSGSGMDLQLLEWLNKHVFPCESAFKNVQHAEEAYTKVVSRFLKNGTTTCSWFATIHLAACQRLVDVVEKLGQRAYIGKVNMDQNSPDYYIETTQDSLDNTKAFIEYTQQKKNKLVTPVITPRFAIACSSTLMKGLSALAKEYNVPIQTHLCENPDEISFTRSLFPDSSSYTAIYDDHGLLGPNSYMAHCVHMTDSEIDLLASTNTGIAHCANSNFSLHSGLCDVRRFMSKGVKVGLGTDVAGGFAPSIIDAMRSSFFASKTIKFLQRDQYNNNNYDYLQPAELIYLATLGGAHVLGLQDTIGSFVPGKAFDALWIDPATSQGTVDLMGQEDLSQIVEKFLYTGSDRNILHVYVNGRRVSGSA
ncbi:guanine deaminase [Halteromyces radiatus]|uniref:guanine deaminase n=1 Tax=Halteromyces radiatus TaxID=101107 RepID=UPI0022201530|nr:guanine deaminase [Halteromyces radiatus]KAI8098979.1 guanine deaminase [Halteromyces radiatus]